MYDPTNPYPAPIQGYSWAGQPPQSMNPFAAAGTSMIQDYAFMKQQKELEQYQQLIQQPAQMSPSMQSRIAYDPQFNFGMVGGQAQMYDQVQRNAMIGGTALALTGATAAAAWPLFNMGGAIAKPILGAMAPRLMASSMGGIIGGASGFMLGGALTAPIYALAQKGIDRARIASDIQGDIEDYSSRWTSGVGFGRSATKSLASEMMRDMSSPGQFFRTEDQLKVHKMGLASGMLKGRDTGEYKRNFESLKQNAQDIIQMLNTTIEGGMSVMKELSGAGITSPAAMRNMVSQARGMGAASGIGTQNALSLGAAGAMAARGTGWSPMAMANAYQSNAVTVANMAQNSAAMNNAVIGMGGVSQAAAAMANIQANVFRSGMGIQSMAAILDPTTKGVNAKAFEQFASGNMGVFGISSRAGAFGMNTHNRVLFEKYQMNAINKMSEEQKAHFYRGIYRSYASTRGGMNEASAWEFAGQYTRNFDERMMFSEMVSSPVNFAPQRSAMNMQNYQMRMAGVVPYTPLSSLVRKVGNSIASTMNTAADSLYSGASGIVGAGVGLINSVSSFLGGARGVGLFDTYRGPNSEAVSKILYGYRQVSQAELNAVDTKRTVADAEAAMKRATAAPGFKGALNNILAGLGSASPTLRQQFFDVFAGGTAAGSNLQDNLWMASNFGLSKQTMAMLKDENIRRAMLSRLNSDQKQKNSNVENAQIARESGVIGDREFYGALADVADARKYGESLGSAIDKVSKRFGGRSSLMQTAMQKRYGLVSKVDLSGATARSAEEMSSAYGSLKKQGWGGGFFNASASDDAVYNAASSWNKASGSDRSALFQKFKAEGLVGENVNENAFGSFISSNTKAIETVRSGLSAQAVSKIRNNIVYGLGAKNASDAVIDAVVNLSTNGKASEAERSQWVKTAKTLDQFKDYKESEIIGFALGKGAGTAASMEMDNIRKAQIDSLEEKIKEKSRTNSGKPTEEIRKLLIDLNQLKSEAQKTTQMVTEQGQQTAAPNILNYWNCQWMVR